MSRSRRLGRLLGIWILGAAAALTLLATWLAPNPAELQFADRAYAPPMRVHVWADGALHTPFVYPQVLENRLMRRYREDTATRVPLSFLARGRMVSIADGHGPLLLFGADSIGRDVFSRLLLGAGRSLGVTFIGALAALLLGALIGGLAGSLGGRVDRLLMSVADFVLVLPGVYLVLVLRSILPLTLQPFQVFWLMAGLFAVAAWPHVARGVRAIVATERRRDYAEAARAAGAGPFRLLSHLLPATRGFLGVELVLLVPALLVAEVTISYLGLGFPEPTPSWGTMLQEAQNGPMMVEAPWMLAPAGALFVIVLALNLVGGAKATAGYFRIAHQAR